MRCGWWATSAARGFVFGAYASRVVSKRSIRMMAAKPAWFRVGARVLTGKLAAKETSHSGLGRFARDCHEASSKRSTALGLGCHWSESPRRARLSVRRSRSTPIVSTDAFRHRAATTDRVVATRRETASILSPKNPSIRSARCYCQRGLIER